MNKNVWCGLFILSSFAIIRGRSDAWNFDETQNHPHVDRGDHPRPKHRSEIDPRQDYLKYIATGNSVTEDYHDKFDDYNNTYTVPAVGDDHAVVSNANLHKPEFPSCSRGMNPSVSEGEPVNTTVFNIVATDLDPPDSGGTVTYSISVWEEEEDEHKFDIDEHTGVVITRKVFDRDEPAREREEYVTIRATDNGRPTLYSDCTVKITITDINDEGPRFGRYESWYNMSVYNEFMPRDLSVGQEVFRVFATDIDDGYNGTVWYKLGSHSDRPTDFEYFDISELTGDVRLRRPFDEGRDQFLFRVVASDRGTPPKSTTTNVNIYVTEPTRRPPTFLSANYPILIQEGVLDWRIPIGNLSANSNDGSGLVTFDLVYGQTEATNKLGTFKIETDGNTVQLYPDKVLDYETVSKYTLTIRDTNKHYLASEITIPVFVRDSNDEEPYFAPVTSGVVLENEPIGTKRLIWMEHHQTVTYSLREEDKEHFKIDKLTGEITTTAIFDRETQDNYLVTVFASDGAPSLIRQDGRHNERPITLKIEIADKNDNPPAFLEEEYKAQVSEHADIGDKVIEVVALDNDTASEIKYSIIEGNFGDAFYVNSSEQGGTIYVNEHLDYEETREYDLKVEASDSLHSTFARVKINVKDNPPVFEEMTTNVTIWEESVPLDCIFELKAYDPDIGDRTLPQNISFFIQEGQEHFQVNQSGCVQVTTSLDRDPPTGSPFKKIIVGARPYDEGGLAKTEITAYQVLHVYLEDINDNPPFYTGPETVVWDENQPKGNITDKLTADDYDAPENGPPFHFFIDRAAPNEIKTSFKIEGNTLTAIKDNFDREEKREYLVPILIVDNGQPSKTGTATLTVAIGNVDDNPIQSSSSKVLVYKYKQKYAFPIGRVFVDDADDRDLDSFDKNKTFEWHNSNPRPFFNLGRDNGYLQMEPSTPVGEYPLYFKVTDNINSDQVEVNVTVTVREISDEAIDSSGSIRFLGMTTTDFITPDLNGKSTKDILQENLATTFGVPWEHVDIFTVDKPFSQDLYRPIQDFPLVVDVRYSVRDNNSSTFFKAEKLNGILSGVKDKLQTALQLQILMIGIDECLEEGRHCNSSCTNDFRKGEVGSGCSMLTNTSSFIRVSTVIVPSCTSCSTDDYYQPSGCLPNPCFHGGVCTSSRIGDKRGFKCECPQGNDGPRCEITSVSLPGTGFRWCKPISVCHDSTIQLHFETLGENGLIFYNGPIFPSPMNVTDFISLELRDGKLLLLLDLGSGVTPVELQNSPKLSDGKPHQVTIKWNQKGISMRVDDCLPNEPSCFPGLVRQVGSSTQLNVNGPLQLGGISFNPATIAPYMHWSSFPTTTFFTGNIANFTYNDIFYDLGEPSYSYNIEGPVAEGTEVD